jgi:hypothetical protein
VAGGAYCREEALFGHPTLPGEARVANAIWSPTMAVRWTISTRSGEDHLAYSSDLDSSMAATIVASLLETSASSHGGTTIIP